jgi:hypothetical protein
LIPMTPGQARSSCLTHLRALIMVAFTVYHPRAAELGTFLLDYAAREVQLETLQMRDPKYRNLGQASPHCALRPTLFFPVDSAAVVLPCPHPGPQPLGTLHEDRLGTDVGTYPTPAVSQPGSPALAPTCTGCPAGGPPAPGRARPPPAAPAPAGPHSQTQIDNPDYLEGDFGRFGQIHIRVRDLLDRLIDTPPRQLPRCSSRPRPPTP